jgi:hypothetical protein
MCYGGANCNAGTCQACGATGQPCCAGSTCGVAGNTCSGGMCVACGMRGMICCTDPTMFPYPCYLPNTCAGGMCIACGYTGQSCCAGGTCGTGQVCDTSTNTCHPG